MITIKKELDFNDLVNECWSGASDTLETIRKHDKEEELINYLEEVFNVDSEIPTMTQINDFLWFESDTIFSDLGIEEEEEVE